MNDLRRAIWNTMQQILEPGMMKRVDDASIRRLRCRQCPAHLRRPRELGKVPADIAMLTEPHATNLSQCRRGSNPKLREFPNTTALPLLNALIRQR